MESFELVLVFIKWKSRDKPQNIIYSKHKLNPISNSSKSIYNIELTNYIKEDEGFYQIGIISENIVFFSNLDYGEKEKLYKIENNLWIIKGEWKTNTLGEGYHHCPSINSVGILNFIVNSEGGNSIQIDVNINSNIDGFYFDKLKDDFDGELWELLISKKSKVKFERKELIHSDKVYNYNFSKQILGFIKEFDTISKNPKTKLVFCIEDRPINKVIPIADTYKKILTQGYKKNLPSKSYKESFDTYENRTICTMLFKVNMILQINLKYYNSNLNSIYTEANNINKNIIRVNVEYPILNREEILKEIESQKENYNNWVYRFNEKCNFLLLNHPPKGSDFNSIEISVKGVREDYSNDSYTFWGNLKENGEAEKWTGISFKKTPKDLFEDGKEVTIKFQAKYTKKTYNNRNGTPVEIFEIKSICSGTIELVSSYHEKIINKQLERLNILESNEMNMLSILSEFERKDYLKTKKSQIETLRHEYNNLSNKISEISKIISELKSIQKLINDRIKSSFYKSIKIKTVEAFKPSMTFLKNSNYKKIYTNYSNIMKISGGDYNKVKLHEKITSYGIQELPILYEYWCLIKIIKVLNQNFNFRPSNPDILLKIIDKRKKEFGEKSQLQLNFESKSNNRKIIVYYQKTLPNNKIPDFIIEIEGNNNKINLVLDSKFKNYKSYWSLKNESIITYNKYSSEKNFVFILHPNTNNLQLPKYTNYGGEKMYYFDEIIYPCHKFGYVGLSPSFTSDLKKVIGLGIEFLIESSFDTYKEPFPENKLFCLNCCSESFKIEEFSYKSGGKYYKNTCKGTLNETNEKCQHMVHIAYCWNCQTRLFKHGLNWDYHKESIWSIFDIHCPNCGLTVADRSLA